MYTFRARIVDRFKAGRCILAGDAAHLTRGSAHIQKHEVMPAHTQRPSAPFLGQGAQMGIRDAANLAWRLALVLAGSARKEILEGYSPERRAPCKFLIVGGACSVVPPYLAKHHCRTLPYRLERLSVFLLMRKRIVCTQNLELKVSGLCRTHSNMLRSGIK